MCFLLFLLLDLFKLDNMILVLLMFCLNFSSLLFNPFRYHQVTGHISSLVHHLKLVLDG